MKPHYQIPILDCGEPLVPIPGDRFALEDPHPYVRLSAPYGTKSPYYLRQGVLEQLITAQTQLQQRYPGWRIQIFDAYRPLAVQQFMVDYTVAQVARDRGVVLEHLLESQRQEILEQVYQFWAIPSSDPATPPPHSTGAAIDITLVNAAGQEVDMGSPIDELSPRSHPNYFAPQHDQAPVSLIHHNRQLLAEVMTTAGFRQHPNEWWHFSWGDQLWAWLMRQEQPGTLLIARYGATERW